MGKALALTLLGFLGCGVAVPALAHVTESDGSISAVLHINPDDDPVFGEPSEFIFEFNDKEGKFNVSGCECAVSITRSGQPIYNEPLLPYNLEVSSLHARFAFIFPAADVYQVHVSGTPRQGTEFQPFNLTYNVRVAKEPSRWPRLAPHFLHLGAGGVFGAVVVGLIIFNHFKKPVSQTPAKELKQD